MRRIFRTRKPTNFKLGRWTEPRFAEVTILLLLKSSLQRQHEAPHGLSAIAELLVSRWRQLCLSHGCSSPLTMHKSGWLMRLLPVAAAGATSALCLWSSVSVSSVVQGVFLSSLVWSVRSIAVRPGRRTHSRVHNSNSQYGHGGCQVPTPTTLTLSTLIRRLKGLLMQAAASADAPATECMPVPLIS